MASYIIPKIGQKVKVNSLVWYKQYDSSLANIRNNDFGFIEAIEYNGNNIRFSSYRDSDVVYSVYFPATPQAVPVTIYCSYDDLIFNPCEELTPVCEQTRYMGPNANCCGNVRASVSGKICSPIPSSVLNDIFGSLLKDLEKATTNINSAAENIKRITSRSLYPRIEPKCKGYSPSLYIIDELSTYDPMKEYIKNDVEMTNQTYLYHALQSMKPVEVATNFTPFPETTVELSMKNFDFEKFINRIFDLPDDGVKEKDPLIKTVKTSEKEKNIMSTIDFRVKKIMHNGPATIVFWKDGTKTVVRLKEGDTYDPYAAFTAAVTKRLYGKNMKISEIVDRYSKDLKKIDITEAPLRDLTVEELKAAAEKLGYRVSKKPKK